MKKRAPRRTNAQLIAMGRALERADVIAQLRESSAGAQRIAERNDKAGAEPGIDISLYVARLEALIGTFEAGCHEGLGDAT